MGMATAAGTEAAEGDRQVKCTLPTSFTYEGRPAVVRCCVVNTLTGAACSAVDSFHATAAAGLHYSSHQYRPR